MNLILRIQRIFRYRLLVAVALILPFTHCKKEEAKPDPSASQYLLSSNLIGKYDKNAIASRVALLPGASGIAQYGIQVYKLTYQTTGEDGKPVTASGALLIPVLSQPLPLISYQHGTIRKEDERLVPSNYNAAGEVWSILFSLMASNGYLVTAPDYIGYGASKDLPHPYEHAPTLASSSLDMMRAAKEFCAKENITLNSKNFLLGYSEGGFATMALHKLVEERHADEFTITASAPGAGAYDKTGFAEYILNSDQPLNFISTYVWVLDSYNRIYGINRPFSYYFNEPWASQLQTNLFAPVNQYPKQLFTKNFRNGLLTGSDTRMHAAFRENNVYDWQPKAPIALFHGTADDYVPFFNSQRAYDAMRARGATQVELRPITGKNHFTAAVDYTLGAFGFISNFR